MSLSQQLVFIIIFMIRVSAVALFWIMPPFYAYVVNAILDACDGPLYKHYMKINPVTAQVYDKVLDVWMYTFAIAYSISQPQIFTFILILLYVFRLVGQAIFFEYHNKRIFVYFPNFFEPTYIIFYAIVAMGMGSIMYDAATLLTLSIAIFIFKFGNELFLHYHNLTTFDNLILPALSRVGIHLNLAHQPSAPSYPIRRKK